MTKPASSYHHLYQTPRWKKIRYAQLAEHPLCAMCEQDGRAIAAVVCDHIKPHKGNEERFFEGPFQSLCKLHHDSTKARQELRGIAPGHGLDGVPLDPNHPFNRTGGW